MARIRTIKPEFPQSESMGRVSRDARLCFIMMWTIADDSGRLRGNSRMLASLLFPYDDDAPKAIDAWLAELDGEGCIVRYEVDGNAYIQIQKWLQHQRIDKPSESKIPEFVEGSRMFANVREASCLDLGPRTRTKEGKGKEGDACASVTPSGPDLVESMVEAWNTMAGRTGLPSVANVSPSRRKLAMARMKDLGWPMAPPEDALQGWEHALAKVEASPFLTGQNDRRWRADFDFILTASKFTKIMEGAYDAAPGGTGTSSDLRAAFQEIIDNGPH